MRQLLYLIFLVVCPFVLQSQIIELPKLKIPGLKWENAYHFDRVNYMKVDYYDKKGKVKQTHDYAIYYKQNGKDFCVKLTTGRTDIESVFDLKNESVIQIFSSQGAESMYNATRFTLPDKDDEKRLALKPTGEKRVIFGIDCEAFIYTLKKQTGKAWIASEKQLSNDYGVFRASKMGMFHNTLSIGGFLMEIESEDAGGSRTMIQTISLENKVDYSVIFENVRMGTSVNKVSYFSF